MCALGRVHVCRPVIEASVQLRRQRFFLRLSIFHTEGVRWLCSIFPSLRPMGQGSVCIPAAHISSCPVQPHIPKISFGSVQFFVPRVMGHVFFAFPLRTCTSSIEAPIAAHLFISSVYTQFCSPLVFCVPIQIWTDAL